MTNEKTTFIMTSQIVVCQTHNNEKVGEFDPLYDNKTTFSQPTNNHIVYGAL